MVPRKIEVFSGCLEGVRLINYLRNKGEQIPRQIGRWACHKLECLADYMAAYTRGLATRYYYLELYAGCGQCLCHGTDCCIDDASLRALDMGFARYIFVVGNRRSAENLKQLTAAGDNVEIITGNCNRGQVIRRVFDLIPRSASSFVLIDPSGYRRLHWATIEQLATHGTDWQGNKMELLIIFPLEMALVRNLMRPECRASITRLYGNQQWQAIKQERLSGNIGLDEVRQQLVELFKAGLRNLGYNYIEDFKPTGFSRQPFYHLILASDSNRGADVLKDAWGKPRYLPCELLYTKQPTRQAKRRGQ